MSKIEHIGIAVNDIEHSKKIFSKVLGKDCYKTEIVKSEQVTTSFFLIGESKIELISPIKNNGPISKFLKKNRQGMHHIAIEVNDIKKEMKRISSEGIRLLNDIPKLGANNKLICFLNPKDTSGVLIELCQKAV